MVTYVIETGIDPDDMRVAETPDNFGGFETKEAAAYRLIDVVNGRMESLRRSKAHAQRVLRGGKPKT